MKVQAHIHPKYYTKQAECVAPLKTHTNVQTLFFPAEKQNELPQQVMCLDGHHTLSRRSRYLNLLSDSSNCYVQNHYATTCDLRRDFYLWSEDTEVRYNSWN